MLAVLEGWRQDGMLPVNGVDIELVVTELRRARRRDSKLAACQKFGTEDEVFAVLGGRIFTEGAECLATRFQIPVIDTDQAPAATMEAAAPYMFTLKPDDDRDRDDVRQLGDRAAARSRARTSALFWEGGHDDAADAFKQILTDAGSNIASEIQSGGQGIGRQRAGRARRPEVRRPTASTWSIFFVGSSGMVNFLQAAADQGYTPGLPRPRLVVAHERRRRRCLQPGPVGGRRGAVGDAARRAARPQP